MSRQSNGEQESGAGFEEGVATVHLEDQGHREGHWPVQKDEQTRQSLHAQALYQNERVYSDSLGRR